MNSEELQNYQKAGQIAKQIKDYAKTIIKKDKPLVEIAEAIEKKIIDLGGETAFPVNLSINEIAAHYTPTLDDETLATGLLKIDIGVHIEGYIADTALSIDLENSEQNKQLIKASQQALEEAQEYVKQNKTKSKLNEIGNIIQQTITSQNLSPIRNLSGHSLDPYEIHSGITIPNYDNNNDQTLEPGAYAIEPFATTGEGVVVEGAGSNIYRIVKDGQPRDPTAREILQYILEKKKTLPFSLREIQRQFSSKARLAIRRLVEANIIEQYPQLIEKTHKPVSQAENTFILTKNKVEITTD